MAIDGLIILDNTGRPIIQSGFRSTSPAYPLLHIDAFNNAFPKATRPGDVDPVLYVPPYNNSDAPSACCHLECGDVRFLCPVSGDVDPLLAFSFLRTFIDILDEYFGGVSAATLKDNFDVVYQLLEETLDSGGHPLTTSSNALRDIVLPPSLLSKLLSATNITTSLNSGGGGAGPFTSPIPWRKAGLRYNSNEIYFDVVEDMKAVVNKHGTTLVSNVWGKIETNTRLSGTPDLLLSLKNPQVLTDCAFHPCVRLQRWASDKALSFVPPDGKFVLMEYRYSPASSSSSAHKTLDNTTSAFGSTSTGVNSGKDIVAVPFAIKPVVEISEQTTMLSITFTSRLTTHAMDVAIEMYLGEGAGGVKCFVGRSSGGGGLASSGFGSGGVGLDMGSGTIGVAGGASWNFDPRRCVLRWELPNAPPGSSWSLKGSFNSSTLNPRPSHALQVTFSLSTYTFSSLKIDQLKVSGEVYKPYKGIRGRSGGSVEWRW